MVVRVHPPQEEDLALVVPDALAALLDVLLVAHLVAQQDVFLAALLEDPLLAPVVVTMIVQEVDLLVLVVVLMTVVRDLLAPSVAHRLVLVVVLPVKILL